MRYSSIIAGAMLLLASVAYAQLSQTGAGSKAGGGAPLVPCTSTGIYNLNNVCNDIYLLSVML